MVISCTGLWNTVEQKNRGTEFAIKQFNSIPKPVPFFYFVHKKSFSKQSVPSVPVT